MDAVQIFNDELQSLLDLKPPVSKAKMGQITRAAMKGVKFYKHIVQSVEKFIAKCRSEYKVPGLYVIDSIVRQSRHQFGIERDVFAMRFSRNLPMTFESLFTGCTLEDKPKIIRVLNLWLKNGVFSAQVIKPLLDMAEMSPGGRINTSSLSASSPVPENSSSSSSKLGQTSGYHSSSGRHQKGGETSLKFSKNMLDFDYGEDDDDGDETPTEAEPPLSSTLNEIEMEQRGQQRTSSSVNQSNYKSSQNQHHTSAPYHQPDPVLERWNRIIRGENSDSGADARTRRSRSRSRTPTTPVTVTLVRQNSAKQNEFLYKPPQPATISTTTTAATTTLTTTNSKLQSDSQPILKSAREAERAAEREKKCLPKIRDKHLTVCSSTLWLGHVPKMVSEADLSNAFGEYGNIISIDLIPPRGCAYVCMDRRQDAKRALNESKDLRLNGSHIKMAWAPGKGFKEYKKLKEYWEVETGSSFIPYSKVDETIDFEVLEEGGVIDEDSMSMEMRERRERKQKEKEEQKNQSEEQQQQQQGQSQSLAMPVMQMLNHGHHPPPVTSMAPFNIPPPSALSQGMIHYPPPSMPIATSAVANSIVTQSTMAKHEETSKAADSGDGSPSSIDQQLSMTERQISMVEQQLNMIKQAQTMAGNPSVSQANPMPPMQAPLFNPHNHPNPMIFDLAMQPGPPLLPTGQPMLDPSIFVNPAQLLCQPPPMLPISQAGMMNPANLHHTMLPHQQQQGRF